MFVNGPNGRIASYHQNNSSYLYYFISDQLGSTRVVMKGTPPATLSNPYIVAEYYNYYPFGQVAEASGNYATAFQWTSKEHDQHGGFDYVYFGSRYYDPRIGAFGSIDKAGQFASGYVYGANNPIIGVDRDGNFFGLFYTIGHFLVNAAIAAAPAAAAGAGTSAATYTAFNLDHWNLGDMLRSAGHGAIAGASGHVLGNATGGISKALGGGAKPSSLRGVFGTAVGSAVSNMAIGYARSGSARDLWKWGVSGFATGAVGASGGFGLAKKGMLGRLGYQAATSSLHSIGNNWASGSAHPFDNFTFGLGPVNLRIGRGEKLINYKDNAYTIWANAIGFASVALPFGKDNNVKWDWRSLSFSYYGGGPIHSLYSLMGAPDATGAFAIYDADASMLRHEGTHIWQSRAMGDLFLPTYVYNSLSGGFSGEGFYSVSNRFEEQAYNDPF